MLIYFLIIRPWIKRRRLYKEMKEAKAQQELRNAERVSAMNIPDLSDLTVVVLDRNDPILDNFPYIKSSLLRNEIAVTNIRIYYNKTHQPVYAMAKVSETAALTECRHGNYTDVMYSDNADTINTAVYISTRGMFGKR